MKFDADPATVLLLRRIVPLSFRLGGVGAIALALVNISLPLINSSLSPLLQYQILTVFYLFIGGLLAVFVYRAWGAASCLADIDLWVIALLAELGSIAIHSAFCMVVSRLPSVTPASNLLTACVLDYKRSVTYGSLFAVVLITFGVWVAVRYMTWQIRKRRDP